MNYVSFPVMLLYIVTINYYVEDYVQSLFLLRNPINMKVLCFIIVNIFMSYLIKRLIIEDDSYIL